MKKILATILAFVYISTSTGATVHMHYCMGKLAEWGFGHVNSNACGQCGMDKNDRSNDGCCDNELTFIKNDNDQKAAEFCFQLINTQVVTLPAAYTQAIFLPVISITESNLLINTAPRNGDIAVYLLDRSLLI